MQPPFNLMQIGKLDEYKAGNVSSMSHRKNYRDREDENLIDAINQDVQS